MNSIAYSLDGPARLWDITSGELLTLYGHTGNVLNVSFSPDGDRLASGTDDNTTIVWSVGPADRTGEFP